MSYRVTALMRKLFDPENILLFVLGTTILSVLGDGVYDLLNDAFQVFTGDTWITRLIITSGAVVTLAIIAGIIAVRVRRAEQAARVLSPPAEAAPHAGLILLVSANPSGAERATLTHHQRDGTLRYCWLLAPAPHDSDEEASVRAFERATKFAQQLQAQGVHAQVEPVEDAYTITSVYHVVQEVLDRAQQTLDADQIIVDVTGGTKVMTAGAVLACRDREQNIEYMYTPRDASGGPQANATPRAMKVLLDDIRTATRTRQPVVAQQQHPVQPLDAPAAQEPDTERGAPSLERATPELPEEAAPLAEERSAETQVPPTPVLPAAETDTAESGGQDGTKPAG
jgi:hypothetical protein